MPTVSSIPIESEEQRRPLLMTSSASEVCAETCGIKGPGALGKGGLGASPVALTGIIVTLHLVGRAPYIEVTAPARMRLDDNNHMRAVRSVGKPSDEQLSFMDTIYAAGALVGVVWSLSDAVALIEGAQ